MIVNEHCKTINNYTKYDISVVKMYVSNSVDRWEYQNIGVRFILTNFLVQISYLYERKHLFLWHFVEKNYF